MWRQWKTPGRRREALIGPGPRSRLTSRTAGSGLDPRYPAKAKALSVGLPNAYFKSLDLPSLVDPNGRLMLESDTPKVPDAQGHEQEQEPRQSGANAGRTVRISP
jgi:hypothetical protein